MKARRTTRCQRFGRAPRRGEENAPHRKKARGPPKRAGYREVSLSPGWTGSNWSQNREPTRRGCSSDRVMGSRSRSDASCVARTRRAARQAGDGRASRKETRASLMRAPAGRWRRGARGTKRYQTRRRGVLPHPRHDGRRSGHSGVAPSPVQHRRVLAERVKRHACCLETGGRRGVAAERLEPMRRCPGSDMGCQRTVRSR